MQRKKQAKTWIKTAYPGIFFRETIDKKTGNVKDHYYCGWYSISGKRYQVIFGSKKKYGWTPVECNKKMSVFRTNAEAGVRPRTFAEERELNEQKEAEKAAAEKAQKAKEITVSDFWHKHYYPNEQARVKAGSKKESSLKRELSLFDNWIDKNLGSIPLIKIKLQDLLNLKKKMLDKGLKMRSVQYCYAVVRQIFNLGISLEIYKGHNPIKLHKAKLDVKINNAKQEWFTVEEFEQISKAVLKKSYDTHALIIVAFNTGARRSELFRLRWYDIDFENHHIHYRETKNSDDRYVPMNYDVRNLLQKIHTDKTPDPENYVFTKQNGEPLNNVSPTFERTLTELGMRVKNGESMNFHHLRHSFASLLAQSGKVNLYELKKLMGHKTIEMTLRYAKLMPINPDLIEKLDVLSINKPDLKIVKTA